MILSYTRHYLTWEAFMSKQPQKSFNYNRYIHMLNVYVGGGEREKQVKG